MNRNDVDLPLSIDEANFPSLPEIKIGRWNGKADIAERLTARMKAF